MPSARLIHPVAELYLDGLFCYQQIPEQTNTFIKWRYARLATLASYSSLEAAINRVPGMNTRLDMARKWKTQFNLPDEQAEFEKFKKFKRIRVAVSHYDGSSRATQRMYGELELYIDEFMETTRKMLIRVHGVEAIENWESNITPRDISEV